MTRLFAAFALVIVASAACADSNEPDSSPAGSWHATRLVATDNGTPTDALAAGATITMVLSSNGATSGTFHIPAALSESGQDENESLAGTWMPTAPTSASRREATRSSATARGPTAETR